MEHKTLLKSIYSRLLKEAESVDFAEKIQQKLSSAKQGGLGMATTAFGSEGVTVVLYKTNIFVGNLLANIDTESGKGGDYEEITSATKRSIVGMITLDKPEEPCNGSLFVKYVASKEGFGPMLYDIAMSLSPSGRIVSDRNSVSDAALKVYSVMHSRSDIKKTKLDNFRDPKTPSLLDDCETWAEEDPQRQILDYSFEGSNIDTKDLVDNHKEALRMIQRYTQKYLGWDPSYATKYISQVADMFFVDVYHALPTSTLGRRGAST